VSSGQHKGLNGAPRVSKACIALKHRRQRTDRRLKRSSGEETSHLDAQLVQILANLARPLLLNGYGFTHLNALARIAYVEAARTIYLQDEPKISIARIAALTGLTRVEVSRLIKTKISDSDASNAQPNRAARVARGWASDKEYTQRNKSPRELSFSGHGHNFSSLVRKHSGDIPARAMLKEMTRLSMVEHTARNTIKLLRRTVTPKRSTVTTLRAIAPWVRFLSAKGERGKSAEHTSKANQVTLYFDSLPQVYSVLRELESRRATFVAGLAELGMRRKPSNLYEMSVSVAVASTKPMRIRD
jgi:hypothetical protein